MKFIRGCLLVVVALIGAIFVVGAFLRSEWSVERSTVVAVPRERVHALVDDLESWQRFALRDPAATSVYGERRRGAGARVTWTSQGAKHVFTIVSSDPVSGLSFTTEQPETGDASTGELAWEPEGESTRVTWRERGDIGWNPVPRMLLPRVIEPLMAHTRSQALEELKRALEAPAASAPTSTPIEPAPR
jgi:hypothetical protein